jgi:hypothetical protein
MSSKLLLSTVLAESLPIIDKMLSQKEVPFRLRPFEASLTYARDCLLRVREGDRTWTPDFDSTDFFSEKWFRVFYREIEIWYQNRYPSEFAKFNPPTIAGLVLIWGNPYALDVPTVVRRSEIPGKWVSFPDYVLDTENPLDWIVKPPALNQLSRNAAIKLYETCVTIASLLRSIRVGIIGIGRRDEVVDGFLETLSGNISRAAEDIVVRRREGTTSGATWEIQKAWECALKALLQQKTGTFRETHDLFRLYDDALPYGLSLNRDLLKLIPSWRKMVNLRYGQGSIPTVSWYFTMYRTMLSGVAAILKPMISIHIGKGVLQLETPPWLRTDDLPHQYHYDLGHTGAR